MNSLIPKDLMTAQNTTRIHDQHNPKLPRAVEAEQQVTVLLEKWVLPAARMGTSVQLNLARPDLTDEIAVVFHRLGYDVTVWEAGNTLTGVLDLNWPARPHEPLLGGRPPQPPGPIQRKDAPGPLARFFSNLFGKSTVGPR
ncbi:hypothetical protein GCM10008959_25750 [Deinococcus seoulensis]|uniref:DUF2249 domain-containing protein n=1 Tax=Deinococcus seoulensis TaxID=1837379 RepID=A0ABQ2RU78_9DEIO|nr:hypothetical protein [Deinococcus seoulensis]GGR62575.1 hypothetical protein GCM10008959_25750 [Deinococcus seoulensis]